MQTFLLVVACVALSFGALVAVLNWYAIFQNYRFHRAGVKRHISSVHLVPQLLVFIAGVLLSRVESNPVPGWLLLVVALGDASLLQILFFPIFWLGKKLGVQT